MCGEEVKKMKKESMEESSGKKEDYKNKVRGVKQMNHQHYFQQLEQGFSPDGPDGANNEK